jgi:DNA adenine methylase
MTKPFLKWVGGKTQIIDELITNFPKKINNYYEIFLGGGSVLLALLDNVKEKKIKITKKIYAYDVNSELIGVYKNVQTKPNELYDKVFDIVNEYESIIGTKINRKPKNIDDAKTSKESYYYWIRKKYNDEVDPESIIKSAMFIFLNKTCFRGVYRVGVNGFNVPFGHYKNPAIINKDNIKEISELIKNVIFEKKDFSDSIDEIHKGDFAYLDPPYAPEKETSFVGYNKNGFTLEQHTELFKKCNLLQKNKIKFILSNSNVELVNNSFSNDRFNIKTIDCKRAINSKDPSKKTKEVIIKSY